MRLEAEASNKINYEAVEKARADTRAAAEKARSKTAAAILKKK